MPRTHKSLKRLYVDLPLAAGETVALEKEQSHYLVAVLRMGEGDRCVLFNGRDGAFLAEIGEARKKGASLRLLEQSAAQTPVPDLWFGFAPIRRLDYLAQKATEMGAGVLQPVITRHVQNPRVPLDKLRANALEAAEQCEVLAVPAVAEPVALPALVAGWRRAQGERMLVFCDEEEGASSPLKTLAGLAGRPLGLLVGPEGGFSPEERDLLRAEDFVVPISLGPRILRADTAAVAALALVQAAAGDWRAVGD